MKDKARVRVLISGQVQGVFFRMETKRFADQIGVTGWVRNRADGKVEAVFEGDESLVNKAVSWCAKGPPRSKVANIETLRESYEGKFNSFDIRY